MLRNYARDMSDARVRGALENLVTEHDWAQFDSPANLAKSIVVEAAELLECFRWDDAADVDAVRDELADVLTYCHLLAARLDLDLDQIVLDKLETTRQKYPVECARRRSAKYDRL